MKKSINAWSFESTHDFETIFRLAKEAGFDGIELNVDAQGHSNHSLGLAITPEELAQISALSVSYSIPVVSISTSLFGNYMGSPKAEERQIAKDIILCQLRCAKALGATGILTVPGGVQEQGSFTKAYAACTETLQSLIPTILEHKIHVGVENVWNGFFLSPFDMIRFLDTIDCEYIGAYYDVGNMIAFSWSEYWIQELGNRITHIHVKDFKRQGGLNSGGRFAALGEGDVNWNAVIPAIRATGFTGYLTAEVLYDDMNDATMSYKEFYQTTADAIDSLLTL